MFITVWLTGEEQSASNRGSTDEELSTTDPLAKLLEIESLVGAVRMSH